MMRDIATACANFSGWLTKPGEVNRTSSGMSR